MVIGRLEFLGKNIKEGLKDPFFISIFNNKNFYIMEITNKNTFTDEKVYFDRQNGLVYVGKACYKIEDLERITTAFRAKDLNDSLNYRVRKYVEN